MKQILSLAPLIFLLLVATARAGQSPAFILADGQNSGASAKNPVMYVSMPIQRGYDYSHFRTGAGVDLVVEVYAYEGGGPGRLLGRANRMRQKTAYPSVLVNLPGVSRKTKVAIKAAVTLPSGAVVRETVVLDFDPHSFSQRRN